MEMKLRDYYMFLLLYEMDCGSYFVVSLIWTEMKLILLWHFDRKYILNIKEKITLFIKIAS